MSMLTVALQYLNRGWPVTPPVVYAQSLPCNSMTPGCKSSETYWTPGEVTRGGPGEADLCSNLVC